MHRRPARPVVLLAALVACVVAASCRSTDGSPTPSAADLLAERGPRSWVDPPEPVPVGSGVVDRHGDREVALALRQVVDPAPLHPRSYRDEGDLGGGRLVALELAAANRGTSTFRGLDATQAVLEAVVVADGSVVELAPSPIGTAHCPSLGDAVRLLPGDGRSGCLTFEVPEGVTPASFRFRTELSPAAPTARWDLAAAPVEASAEVPVAPGAAIGERRALTGSGGDGTGESGAEVEVAVTGVVDPAEGDVFGPLPGLRYVAVELALRNTGDTPYVHARGTSVVVGADAGGYRPALFQASCELGAGGWVLEPGEERRGCVLFEVPEHLAVTAFELAIGLGRAEPGRWLLP